MTKCLFSILLFGISISAIAQNPDKEKEKFFRFGAKAGVNINKISGSSFDESFRFNFQLGGFAQFNFSDRFGIQPEVNFVQSTSEKATNGNVIYDDIFGGGTQNKSKLNYLEVPLLLNVNIGPSKRVKLQLGPAFNGMLKQTVDSLRVNGDIYKNSEWSAIGGIWFQLPLVNMGARYKLGLTNINSIDDREEWKNQSIQIFVGVTF